MKRFTKTHSLEGGAAEMRAAPAGYFQKSVLFLIVCIFWSSLHAQTGDAPAVRLRAALDTGEPERMEFAAGGREIKVVLRDKVQFWDAETGRLLRTVEADEPPPKPPKGADSVWFGWTKKFEVLALKKGKGETLSRVVIWDREKKETVAELKGFTLKIGRSEWSRDASRLLTFSETKKPSLFSLSTRTQTEIINWEVPAGRLRTRIVLENLSEFDPPLISPDGRRFVTRQVAPFVRETALKVWDTENGSLLYELTVPPRKTADGKEVDVSNAYIFDLKFTSDGKLVIGRTNNAHYPNTSDGNLVAWRAETGEVVWQTPDISPHSERYTGFRFSGDEKNLVAIKEITLSILKGKEERTAEIRDVETGKLLVTLKNPEPDKRKIAAYGGYETESNVVFSPSAKTLITADTEKAEIWNAASGEQRCAFPRVWESATAIFSSGLHTDDFRFRANEKIIVAENDRYLRVWNAENCALVEKIETPDPAVWRGDDHAFLSLAEDKKSVLLWEVIAN